MVAAQCRTDTVLTSCCSDGGPRQPWSSGLAPVSRFHSSVPLSHSSPSLTGLLASADVKQQKLTPMSHAPLQILTFHAQDHQGESENDNTKRSFRQTTRNGLAQRLPSTQLPCPLFFSLNQLLICFCSFEEDGLAQSFN